MNEVWYTKGEPENTQSVTFSSKYKNPKNNLDATEIIIIYSYIYLANMIYLFLVQTM